MNYGPTLPISQEIHQMKYRGEGETFKEAMARVADSLKDDEEHYGKFKDILYNQRFLARTSDLDDSFNRGAALAAPPEESFVPTEPNPLDPPTLA